MQNFSGVSFANKLYPNYYVDWILCYVKYMITRFPA